MPNLLSLPCPRPAPPIVGIITQQYPMGVADGTNPIFRLTYPPSQVDSLQVWVNGILQRIGVSEDYTFSGTTITFNAGAIPRIGDVVYVYYLR